MIRSLWTATLLALLGCAVRKAPTTAPPAAHATSTRYCSGYRASRQGPRCIRELTAQEARQSAFTWKLVYDQGRVVHSLWQNGRGFKQSDDDGDVEYNFIYKEGQLVEYQAIGRTGHVRLRSVCSDNCARVDRLDAWGRPLIEDDSARVAELRTFDANGFVREVRFIGLDGKPAKSAAGVYMHRSERDARGLELRACSFDAEGRPMLTRWGAHCVESNYDDFGNAVQVRYFDVEGKPTQNLYGVHRGQHTVEKYGNVVRTTWFGLDGKPSISSDFPGARCTTTVAHVVDGVRVGGDCLNERDEPSPFRPGNAFWRETADEQGRASETRWFGADGAPVASPNFATMRYVYGEKDFVTEKRFYLADGTPGQRRGPAMTRSERGDNGLVKSELYLDARGEPSELHGCSRRDFEWDRYRKLTALLCLDPKGRRETDEMGVSIRRFTYRNDGLLDEIRYFDTENKPANSSDGFARSVTQYDSQGTETCRLLYDKDNQRVMLPRFRVMRARPPYVNKEWTYGSRQLAIARLEEARRRLLAGEEFGKVAMQFSDLEVTAKRPGDDGYYKLDTVYPAVRLAVEKLRVNEVSPVVEIPAGLQLYQRIE